MASSDTFHDPADSFLFPEEETLVVNAVAKRRREFTTGRMCARIALAELGVPPGPILQADRGAPRWPAGVVGSVAHCAGYRAAAVARATQVATIGIDAEPDEPLDEDVLAVIAGPDEIRHLAELSRSGSTGPSWDRLLFCAKETVYKAWFPLTRRWLGFEQAAVTIDPVTRTFDASLLAAGCTVSGRPIARFPGRWLAREGLIIAAVTLPVPSP